MPACAAAMLTSLADASAASHAMQTFVAPVFATLCVLATLASTFFLVNGGIAYMTSTGRPDKLEHAKKVIKNALIGLVVVLAAAAMTALLTHAYHNAATGTTNVIPQLSNIKPTPASAGLVDVLIKAITGLLQNIIQTAAQPFLDALAYFTKATPMMAANSSVFNLWLAIVGIADALFVLVVALLGFHVMSHASLGLEEIEIKHMLPQIGLAFLALNMSIFAIDAIISLSNAMIHALYAAFPVSSVWRSLEDVTKQSAGMGLVALLIMVAFLVFAVILLIYYVTRLVTLYLGAILSPLFVLLWLLPAFRDFAVAATKTYLTTVFVLFVHVVILLLAASIFAGMVSGSPDKSLDPIMSSVVGLAALIALLRTQGVLNQLAYVSIGPKAMRRLGGQFINSVSYATTKMRTARAAQ